MLISNKEKILKDLEEELLLIENEKSIIEAKNIFIKKYLTPLYAKLKEASINDKKDYGQEINSFSNKIEELSKNILKNKAVDSSLIKHVVNYDVGILTKPFLTSNLHPITLVINQIINFFEKLDFEILSGEEIVSPKYNFSNLNVNDFHPARAENDSFYIDDLRMLRTHCTATTAQAIENNVNSDIRVLSYGNVYRNDDDDLTHSHQFTQVDIVWIRENLNLGNLKWIINELLIDLFGPETKTRFRLSNFPFTEPSFEVDVSCHKCNGKGCNVCKQTGWIEILGAGMLHENVLKAANITNIKTGLAAGIGIERIAMIKYGISDIREFYTNDFRFLKQFNI